MTETDINLQTYFDDLIAFIRELYGLSDSAIILPHPGNPEFLKFRVSEERE